MINFIIPMRDDFLPKPKIPLITDTIPTRYLHVLESHKSPLDIDLWKTNWVVPGNEVQFMEFGLRRRLPSNYDSSYLDNVRLQMAHTDNTANRYFADVIKSMNSFLITGL